MLRDCVDQQCQSLSLSYSTYVWLIIHLTMIICIYSRYCY